MLDRLVWAQINVSNFIDNLREIRTLVGPAVRIMAVVKANAYGHGAIELAKEALKHEASYLGVVCLYEAKQLRNAGIRAPILILSYIDCDSLAECIDLDLTLNIMDENLVKELDSIAGKKHTKAKIHIKVDTGMHRLGIMPDKILSLLHTVTSCKNIILEGIFTHFATADEHDLSFAYEQLHVFKQILAKINRHNISAPLIHAANSAATLRIPQSHYNMVRPGIILYGMKPSSDFVLPFVPKPVLSLKTSIVQIRKIKKGETVGYGRTFTASRPTLVGAIPVGYADGFRRSPRNWTNVLVGGHFAPILGRISMDQTSIDISDCHDVAVGDEVVLVGAQGSNAITADDVASTLGTINYEV